MIGLNSLSSLIKFPRPTENVEILGKQVWFSNDEVKFSDVQRIVETNLNFVTIASARAQDVLIEEVKLDGTHHVYIDYAMHRLIVFDVEASDTKELVFKISEIYVEVFKNFAKEAEVCCSGFEFLYLAELRFNEANVVSLKIDYKEVIKKKTSLLKKLIKYFRSKNNVKIKAHDLAY